MNRKLNEFIGERYSSSQKKKAQKTFVKYKDNKHMVNYEALSHAFDKMDEANTEEVKEMFDVKDVKMLTKVDWVIANIIKTLTLNLNEDISEGYESAIVLDRTQPELEYLIEKTKQYLDSK